MCFPFDCHIRYHRAFCAIKQCHRRFSVTKCDVCYSFIIRHIVKQVHICLPFHSHTHSHTLTQRPNPSKIYPHKVLLRIRPSSNRRSINSCRIIYLSNRIVWNYFIFAFVRFHSRIHKAQFPTCANILIHIDINGRNGEKQYIILVN